MGSAVVGQINDLLVVAAERFAVHVEEENAGCVDAPGDDDFLCCCWIRRRWEREVWGCLGEVILSSVSIFAGILHKIDADAHCRTCCHRRELPLFWALRWNRHFRSRWQQERGADW